MQRRNSGSGTNGRKNGWEGEHGALTGECRRRAMRRQMLLVQESCGGEDDGVRSVLLCGDLNGVGLELFVMSEVSISFYVVAHFCRNFKFEISKLFESAPMHDQPFGGNLYLKTD